MAYRGRFFIRSRVWRTGQYASVAFCPIFQPPGMRRSKCRPSRECQQTINERESAQKLLRIVRENFSERDLELDLTYGEPPSVEDAVKEARKFIRRVRQSYRKAGAELKWVLIWEQGVRSGRVHFHMILNGGPLSRDELEAMWPHGYTNSRRLRMDEKGLAPLTEYLTKKSRYGQRKAGQRRWTCSRNLHRPEPGIRDGAFTVQEVETLAEDIERRSAEGTLRELLGDMDLEGMTLVEAEALRNPVNRGLCIRLELAAPETWHGRRPVPRYLSGELGQPEEDPAEYYPMGA